jgi:hypothetical protein
MTALYRTRTGDQIMSEPIDENTPEPQQQGISLREANYGPAQLGLSNRRESPKPALIWAHPLSVYLW